MQRVYNSWAIFKQSWAVLRQNPALNIFPILSTLVGLLVTASFWTPVALYIMSHREVAAQVDQGGGPMQLRVLHYVLIFGFYICTYFVINFFNCALIFCAKEALMGRKPTVGDGLHAATSRLGGILAWTLVAATVGTLLQMASDKLGIVGKIVTALLGTAWNILTFFTLPVLILEGRGPIDSVKGSWNTIKKTWGESLIINWGVSSASGILFLLPILPFIAICFTGNAAIIITALVLMLIYWVILSIVTATLTGIFKTAVFLYAENGVLAQGFDAQYIQNAFAPKPEKNGVSGYTRF